MEGPDRPSTAQAGGAGTLAQALVSPRSELDSTDEAAICARILQTVPDAVVESAAFTSVGAANEGGVEAHRVDADATAIAASACHKIGAALVYPNTDYVFSGEKRSLYHPDGATGRSDARGCHKWAGDAG